jgi:signal transduction histidine kinase
VSRARTGSSTPLLRSSATRLAVSYLIIMLVGVSTLLVSVYYANQEALRREFDLRVQAESEAMRDEFQFNGIDELTQVLQQRADDWGRIGAVYLLMDANGRRLAGNLSGWPGDARAMDDGLEFTLEAREGNRQVEHPARGHVLKLGTYRLLIGTDVSERTRMLQQMRRATVWGIGLTALLTVLVAWWYRRRIAARVSGVADACANIMSGDLSRRLPGDGSHDEFDNLTAAVNTMLERLEHQAAVLRTTFNSAAHDLRTPLQRIRIRLENGLHTDSAPVGRAALSEALADIERVQRTLATLLQIAHADSGAADQHLQQLDIAALAQELVELYVPVAREHAIELTAAAEGVAGMSGNRQLLAQLLVNLIENALRHVPAGGHVLVRTLQRGERTILEVADDGPGIPVERHAEALLPFRRLQDTGEGASGGLGLSLVSAVVRMHQGNLSLHDNAPGLRVHCDFPAAG